MMTEVTAVLERRRLRRRATTWRVIAIVLGIAALVAIGAREGGFATMVGGKKQIARVKISGLIADNRKQVKLFEKLAKADNVAAVLLAVNSPGGTTAGGEALYEAIRELAKQKPVVASFGTMATSAAYIVGLASDQIVARGNTVTGSVGVIFQWAEVHGLLEKLGLKMNEVKSGRLKAMPSMFAPLDEAGRSLVEELVLESQGWFLGLVRTRRNIDPASVPGLVEGRIYSGRQALNYKLIDAIGGEDVAVDWLEKKRGIAPNLAIKDWQPEKLSGLDFLSQAMSIALRFVASAVQLPGDLFTDDGVLGRLRLDGLVSVWHPAQD